ncbi:SpaA isopeptide-forming pilin-related protein [Salininema proteolyticum]|uniref:SpaA isopeptide-forming pilin-related protein n=1 Tax=Salininema proteolyticum TaxID=1607685 RepID=A0ABV8U1I6_9ACTN
MTGTDRFGAPPHRRRPAEHPPKRLGLRGAWRAAIALSVAASAIAAVPQPAAAEAGDGTVTVRVVREVNANGEWDGAALEPGMSGVTVNLTDDAGNTISGTTDGEGLASIDPSSSDLTGGRYRVQVINPDPDVLYSAFANHDGMNGGDTSLSSTESFVDLSGGNDASVVTAYWNPADYCQENATLVTACLTNDVNTSRGGDRTLVKFPYNARGNNDQTTDLSTKSETGALYGIAYSRQSGLVFSGAHAHRASEYGPGGPGAIYVTDPDTGDTSVWATVPNAGTTEHDLDTWMDLGFASVVAKESLGDIEVSENGQDLYAVNLNDRKLYRYDATQDAGGSPTAVYDIPQPDVPCPDTGDWRPYGLGFQDGVLYVGGTCSGESTQDRADLRAVIRTFDPGSGTFGEQVMDQPLDFDRAISDTLSGPCQGTNWYPWTDDLAVSNDDGVTCAGRRSYPTPILGDIVVDTDGALIVSFRDRYTDQLGFGQHDYEGSPAAGRDPASGGALYRACADGDMYTLDANGGCGGAGEYYYQTRNAAHNNALFSGIALSKVETTIASSSIDPIGPGWTGGTAFVNRDGSNDGFVGNQLTNSFGKGGSMADLEVLCDEAPIQIGNYVWYDVDKDGVQDPGEDPVPGATVNLYDADDNVVGTTTTSDLGEYYFDDSNVPGGLQFRTDYTIRIDNPADYEEGGPLYRWVVTQNDAGDNDFIDSDGIAPDGSRYPEHSITTGSAGQDNHTYDFGYHQPKGEVRVVKTDTDKEKLAGAEFQLWQDTNGTEGLQMDGDDADTAVGDVCTTDGEGLCSATVEWGTYWWEETKAPDDHRKPDPDQFGPMVIDFDSYEDGVTVTAVNEPILGKLTLLKLDDGDSALPGAEFTLWRESNGEPGLQRDGDVPVDKGCTTDSDGRCDYDGLRLGEYYLEETAAPHGYRLPDNPVSGPHEVTADHEEEPLEVTVSNEPEPPLPQTSGSSFAPVFWGWVGFALAVAGAMALLVIRIKKRSREDSPSEV